MTADVKPSRTRKFNAGTRKRKSRKSPLAMSTNPQLRMLQVDVPVEFVDWLEDVACYEERSKSTVARSILWLGRRVYTYLAPGEVSPFAPACIDVSDNEIEAVAELVKSESKAGRSWKIAAAVQDAEPAAE